MEVDIFPAFRKAVDQDDPPLPDMYAQQQQSNISSRRILRDIAPLTSVLKWNSKGGQNERGIIVGILTSFCFFIQFFSTSACVPFCGALTLLLPGFLDPCTTIILVKNAINA